MMNGITLDNQTPQVAFRARKINDIKKAHRVVDQINDAAIKFLNKDRPLAEQREKAIKKSLEALTIKNMISIQLNYLKTQTFVGLGKFLGKCNKVVNKIPFIKEARINAKNKKFAQYEQYVNKALKDGVMDADQAGELLIKADPKITKV